MERAMMRMMRRAALAAVLGTALAQAADAQVVRGRVVESRTGRPLPTASITVLDSAGQPAGYGQSDAFGEFTVRLARAGSFFVRAERVGYRPATSALSDVDEGDEAYRVLALRQGDPQLEGAGAGLGGLPFPGRILGGPQSTATDTRPATASGPADAVPAGSGDKSTTTRPAPAVRVGKPARDERPARAPRPPRPAARGGTRQPGA
jgi:hypothetical protein